MLPTPSCWLGFESTPRAVPRSCDGLNSLCLSLPLGYALVFHYSGKGFSLISAPPFVLLFFKAFYNCLHDVLVCLILPAPSYHGLFRHYLSSRGLLWAPQSFLSLCSYQGTSPCSWYGSRHPRWRSPGESISSSLYSTHPACASDSCAVVGSAANSSCVDSCDIYQGMEGTMSLALGPLDSSHSPNILLCFPFPDR